jgi:hypothetical protein
MEINGMQNDLDTFGGLLSTILSGRRPRWSFQG